MTSDPFSGSEMHVLRQIDSERILALLSHTTVEMGTFNPTQWLLSQRTGDTDMVWPLDNHDALIECVTAAIKEDAMDVTETAGAALERMAKNLHVSSNNIIYKCILSLPDALEVPESLYGDPYSAANQPRPYGVGNSQAEQRDARYRRALRCVRWSLEAKADDDADITGNGTVLAALCRLMAPNVPWCSDATQQAATELLNALARWAQKDDLILSWKALIADWAVAHAVPPDTTSVSYPNCAAFTTLVSTLRYPNVSSLLGLIIAVALRACDCTAPVMKGLGAELIHQCVRETAAAELRWHSHVIMTELDAMLGFRDDEFIAKVVPIVIDASLVLDGKPSGPHRRDVVKAVLRELSLATSIKFRRIYLDVLPRLFEAQGIDLLSSLRSWLPVLFDQLLCGHDDIVSSALKSISIVVKTCWPRVPAHQSLLFRGLCQCYMVVTNEAIRGDIEELIVEIWAVGKKNESMMDMDDGTMVSVPDVDIQTMINGARDVQPLTKFMERLGTRCK